MTVTGRTGRRELLTGAAVLFVSNGIVCTLGLFLVPMSSARGWTREVFAFAIALQNLVWGVSQPVAGRLCDRFGSGKVVLGGALLYACGLLGMSQAGSATALSLSAGVLVGLGLAGTSSPVMFGAIARAVSPARRTVAMGFLMAISGLGQFAMPPAAARVAGVADWPGTLVVLAGVSFLMVPLSVGLFERSAPSVHGRLAPELSRVLGQALGARSFWLLSLGFFVCGFHVVFLGTHLPAHLGDHGLSAATGALVLALIGLFNVCGAFLAGWLGDRMSRPRLLVIVYLTRAVVFAAFALAPVTRTSAFAFAVSMGLLWNATVPPTNGAVASMFGVRSFTLLAGIVFLFHQVGAFAGGWLGGRIHGSTGSYFLALWTCVGLSLVAALFNALVDEARLDEREASGASPQAT